MKTRIVLLAILVLATNAPVHAAEPATCSEAYRACAKPDFGHCDAGCVSTCRLRLEGCMKTGSFATPRALLKGLKRQ
jgi:hypothetical protein